VVNGIQVLDQSLALGVRDAASGLLCSAINLKPQA
jgi:hypothetical protein